MIKGKFVGSQGADHQNPCHRDRGIDQGMDARGCNLHRYQRLLTFGDPVGQGIGEKGPRQIIGIQGKGPAEQNPQGEQTYQPPDCCQHNQNPLFPFLLCLQWFPLLVLSSGGP